MQTIREQLIFVASRKVSKDSSDNEICEIIEGICERSDDGNDYYKGMSENSLDLLIAQIRKAA